ncbi:MAG TPA: poly-beta-1,6 N-acetyl-D-glucosamine export porin PgaA [Spongiibacteraceae bacterium]|jgi:biofilm PGA synthesis protein PgaA|nr:poly-beta-1,6 N-acetyl-D-glucosamine export porin PgaA [Spongiibacteraceae bacterium]HUH36843.1 poly-beta-1,6 N-acetyl-D-glucosamine export porin PgaA [Spongiibacteraceae bacterium]
MIKHLVSLLIPTALVVFLFFEISGTAIYTDSELRHVSERAVAMAREQRYDAAQEQFDAIFTVAPDFLPARADYLVVLSWQARHAEMLAFAETLPWHGLPDYALEALVTAALEEGRPALAGRYAEQAMLNSEPDPALRGARALRLSRQLLAADQAEAASRVLALGLQAQPDNPELLAQARIAALPPLSPAEDGDQSLASLRHRYEREPSAANGLALARALTDSGEADAAVALLNGLNAAGSDDPGLILALAYALERQGEFGPAADQFARALQLGAAEPAIYDSWLASLARAPRDTQLRHRDLALAAATPAAVRRGYARLLLAQRAYEPLDRLVGDAGAPADIGSLLGRAGWEARRQRQFDHALAIYAIALRHYPVSREFPLAQALVLSESGQRARADQAFAALLASRPDDRQVLDGALAHARRYGDVAQQEVLLARLMQLDTGSNRFVGPWLALLEGQPPATVRAKLEAAHRQWPGDPQIGVALAAAWQQASDCEAALDILARLTPQAAQAERAGYIARSCDAPALAARWYRSGLEQRSAPRLQAGLMLALALQDQHPEAEALYRALGTDSADISVLQAQADYASARGDWQAAAGHYARMLALETGHDEAWRGQALALSRAGEPERALALAGQRPALFAPEEWALLRAEGATQLLGEAEQAAPGEARTLNLQALALLEAARPQVPGESALGQRLDNDRIVVLGRLGRDDEMFAAARQRDPDPLPDYVLLALSDAHLRRGEADRALALVEQVAARHPDDAGLQRRRFYAYLDADRPEEAEQILAALADQARGDWDPAGAEPLPWALRQAAVVDAWHNRLDAAQAQLETYHAQRPDDIETSLALATVYRWQGLPSRALPLYDRVRDQRPLPAAVGATYARWDRRELPEVQQRVEALPPSAADPDVAGLREAWTLARSPQLVARTSTGRSSGTTFGSRDADAEVWLYGAPLAHRYRVFGHDRYAWAELPEGNGRLHRAGVGVDYRGRTFGWRAEIDTSLLDDDADAGLSLSGRWQPDDHWQLDLEAQSYSRDLPLRAIRAGIDGESLTASARYSWNAGHWLQGGASALNFSDGNDRSALWLNHGHRIYGSARHQLTLRESVYTSSSSRGDEVPYYNPDRDVAASVTGEYVGRLRADTIVGWQHRLALGMGQYWQQDYGGAFIWDAEYEHRWQLTPALHLNLGALYRHRTYDGDGEGYWAAFGGLDWRF